MRFFVRKYLLIQLFPNQIVVENITVGLFKCQKGFIRKLEITAHLFLQGRAITLVTNNPGQVYLSPDLSIARMYCMFLAKHDPTYIARMQRKRNALINHQATTDSQEVKPIIGTSLSEPHIDHDNGPPRGIMLSIYVSYTPCLSHPGSRDPCTP